jgi:peptidoglycan hydrolase-like protein with peptidoglycan-binding domain
MAAFDIPKLTLKTLNGTITGDLVDLVADRMKSGVGIGASNLRNDVALIQQLLTLASAVMGPHVFPGQVDGIYGPLTAKAINAYQRARLGKADGVINPKRVTIRHLALDARWGSGPAVSADLFLNVGNGHQPKAASESMKLEIQPLPPGITQDALESARALRAYKLLGMVVSMCAEAIRVINIASANAEKFKRTNEGAMAVGLFKKHFEPSSGIGRLFGSTAFMQLAKILDIFRSASYSATARQSNPTKNGDFVGVHEFTVGPATDYVAEATKGGYWIPDDKIALGPLMDNMVEDSMFAATLLHEIIHTIGSPQNEDIPMYKTPPKSRPVMGDLYPSSPLYAGASSNQRAQAASFYEAFALECFAGTDTLKNRHSTSVAKNEFSRPPTVLKGGISI